MAELLCSQLKSLGWELTHFIKRPARPGYQSQATRLRYIPGDSLVRNLVAVDSAGLQLLLRPEIRQADLVHVHDPVVAWGARIVEIISRFKPTVITMHDFSLITGGCLNPGECRRYTIGCGRCPQVGAWPLASPVDSTRRQFQLHARISRQPNCIATAPSRYVADLARQGTWRGGRLQVIPNAADTDVFTPLHRKQERERLGLPDRTVAVLFVAYNVQAPSKGFGDLTDAFATMAQDDQDLHLLIVGRLSELPRKLVPFCNRVHRYGAISDDHRLASIYAASDLYVTPTRRETFHLCPLEAMSCGTPVVAYPTGGIPEYATIDGCWLADPPDVRHLTERIKQVIPQVRTERLREQVRSYVVENFGVPVFVKRFDELYREEIARFKRHNRSIQD